MKTLKLWLLPLVVCSLMASCNDEGNDDNDDRNVTNPEVIGFKITGMDIAGADYLAMQSDEYGTAFLVGIKSSGETFRITPKTNREGKFEVDAWEPANIIPLYDNYLLMMTQSSCGYRIDEGYIRDNHSVYAAGYLLRKSDGRMFEIGPSVISTDSEGYITASRKGDIVLNVSEDEIVRFDDRFYFEGRPDYYNDPHGIYRVTLPASGEPEVTYLDPSYLRFLKLAPNGQAYYWEDSPRIHTLGTDERYTLDESRLYNRVSVDYDPASGNWVQCYLEANNGEVSKDLVVGYIILKGLGEVEYREIARRTVSYETENYAVSVIAMNNRIYVNIGDPYNDKGKADFGLYFVNGTTLNIIDNTPGITEYVSDDRLGNRRVVTLHQNYKYAIEDNNGAGAVLRYLYDGGMTGKYSRLENGLFTADGTYLTTALSTADQKEQTFLLEAVGQAELVENKVWDGYYYYLTVL